MIAAPGGPIVLWLDQCAHTEDRAQRNALLAELFAPVFFGPLLAATPAERQDLLTRVAAVSPDTARRLRSALRQAGPREKRPRATRATLRRLLDDPDCEIVLGYSELSRVPTIRAPEAQWRDLDDHDLHQIALWLDERHDLDASAARATECILGSARSHPHHPIREWLEALTWDGQLRAEHWLQDYLGVADSTLARAYSRCTLIAAVARAYRPGSQVHTVLVLVGPQGAGKSRCVRALSPFAEWHSDAALEVGTRDGNLALRGVWLYEWGELDNLHRREAESIKAWISRGVDRYRAPYGRLVETHPRSGILIGTSNRRDWLTDPSGSRRWWPVTVGTESGLLPDALAAVAPQLWAEACDLYRSHATWWLDEQGESDRIDVEPEYAEPDPWDQLILAWMGKRPHPPTIADIAEGALKMSPDKIDKRVQARISVVLGVAGYERHQVRVTHGRAWVWRRSDSVGPPMIAELPDQG